MAKDTGIGARFFAGRNTAPAYDLSGDIGALNAIGDQVPTIDVSAINATVDESLLGRPKGEISYTAFFNAAVGAHHAIMAPFRSAAALLGTVALYEHRDAAGNPCAFGTFLELGYRATRAGNSALSVPISLSNDGQGPCWGTVLWAGTDASAAVHASVDLGVCGIVQTISAVSVANPTHLTCVGHGLVTGDTILVSSNTSTPSLNGDQTVTVLDADHFTVPVNVTVAGTGGTFQRSSARNGFRAIAMMPSLGSGSMVPLWEDSADNSTFATLAGSTMAAMTAADGCRFVQVQTQALVRRYVRVSSTGTFTTAAWRAGFARRLSMFD